MARINSLTNFLDDVATAIKQKTGDNTPIPASEFDTEILSIETAGTYQQKTLTITQNGITTLTPDTGFDAIDQVVITVDVPIKQLQSKTVSVTSNGNVTLLPDTDYDGFNEVNLQVNVPQQGGSGDVKLFETIADMQADADPQEGDLAVVYVNTRKDLTRLTEFQKAMFPKTVVLSSSTSISRTIEFRINPDNSYNRLRGAWNRNEFYLTGAGSLSGYDIYYTSNDGLTYTLDTINNKRVSSDTVVDFGVTLKFYSSSSSSVWRDAYGKFIQIINREFNGLFVYNTDSYQIAPTQLDVTSDYVYEKTYYGNNGVEVGTLAETPPSNSFADASAAVYSKTKQQYESMTPRVLTDSDKTIDRNIYVVPEKADGTPLLDTSAVTDMSYMFSGCKNLLTIALLDTSNVTNMEKTFNKCSSLLSVPLLDTSNVTNMQDTFYGCSSLTDIPLLDTSKVTSMYYAFFNCSSLTDIPLLDTSEVTNMRFTFHGCSSLTDIPLLDTSNVTNMQDTFYGCSSLTDIPLLDTSKVTDMSSIFMGCSSLTTIPLLDSQLVTDMGGMFYNCSSLTSIPLLNTSIVTDMSYMFYGCTNLTTVPLLNTSNVTTMASMFSNCPALSNESLNNILQMCANATSYTGTKTLKALLLTETQATTCQGLSNYSAFTAAGWTTGY